MDHGVDSLGGAEETRRLQQVAVDELRVEGREETAPLGAAHQEAGAEAELDEPTCHRVADEAGGSGHQDPAHRIRCAHETSPTRVMSRVPRLRVT